MRQRTKHRIKIFFVGLGLIAVIWLLVPSPLCLIPRFCPGGFSIVNYLEFGGTRIQTSETYVNVPGFLAAIFASTWLMGTLFGIAAMYLAIRPEKYELRRCPKCGMETEQFQSGTKFKEGFKYKWGMRPEVLKAATVSYEYTCERCRKKTAIPNPDYNPEKAA